MKGRSGAAVDRSRPAFGAVVLRPPPNGSLVMLFAAREREFWDRCGKWQLANRCAPDNTRQLVGRSHSCVSA